MSDFSVVCLVSKPEVFDKCLLKSIYKSRNDYDVEIIPIFNPVNRYSASVALNIGLEVSNSDYVITVHQDVTLLQNWFEILDDNISRLPSDWAVLGSAGIALEYGCKDIGVWGGALNVDTVAVGSVWSSEDTTSGNPDWAGAKELKQTHCVDECLMVVNKKSNIKFDQKFNGYHFYGVDYCMQARSIAKKIYCSHLPIIHYGKYSASMDNNNRYWHFLRYLYSKWHYRYPELLGTHMHWGEDGITSYIPMQMESDDGKTVQILSMKAEKVNLNTDRQLGFFI